MTELDQEQEAIVALCNELSADSAGYQNHIVFRATLNVLATAIVNACDTLPEAEIATDETSAALATAVKRYWQVAHPN
jgi:hypothetical protein